MPPFLDPVPIITGLKERVDSLAVHGDKIYVGTSSGNLHIYTFEHNDNDTYDTRLMTTKSLSKKPIEQVGYIKNINSVVALSDSCVTLYPLPHLIPPIPLPQTRKAFSFAINSTVENVSPEGRALSFDEATAKSPGVSTSVTYLVVGSQRKLLVYSWRDSDAQEAKEAPLPHSARVIVFLKPTVLCLAYPGSEHVLFNLETMAAAEITMPVNAPSAISTSVYGMNALSSLGGYMKVGLAAKAKPQAIVIGEDVLIPKDSAGMFFAADGNAKGTTLLWNAPPEDIAYVKPYVLTIQPAGTMPSSSISPQPPLTIASQTGFIQTPVLQVQSGLTFQPVQSVALTNADATPANFRLLTVSAGSSTPAFAVSSPVDRTAATSDGATIWAIRMRAWGAQLDELVESKSYTETLALLDSLDERILPDKNARKAKVQALNAVAQFRNSDFDSAMNTFIDLDINPAKVVALYPASVSGRLHVPQEQWITLFGGPAQKTKETVEEGALKPGNGGRASPTSSLRVKRKGTIDVVLSSAASVMSGDKEDDRGSLRGKPKERTKDTFPRSLETLLRYLTDRRPKVKGALEVLNITSAQSHRYPMLSETSVDELLALPNAPLSLLTPEQLTRFAQVVDTALFKAYLIVRPGLLGPLCSVDNWCEVLEVEEVLMEREKFSELVSLYKGKKMHGKALSLLRRLSDKEFDPEDKIRPTVSYVQNLGPEYLEQVFDAARWVYGFSRDIAFDIFTAEIVELPRFEVADFLEQDLDADLCARYLEYLIFERDETSALFHDRLAALYLDIATRAIGKGEDAFSNAYNKLLHFIQTSNTYRIDRLFGLLPPDGLYEARAILLGRMGRHESALETYVYRLGDYIKAEEYCKSIYRPNSPTQDIFLSLLKIYLEPHPSTPLKQYGSLLRPALELISRQSPRLDTLETLRLLPPLVPAQDVKAFLCDAARAPIFDTRVIREIRKGWNEQVARRLMSLQSRRVRVTDTRMCPQCHKRLGNSVIAVHAPRGEVTHYQCREAFAAAKGQHAEHTH